MILCFLQINLKIKVYNPQLFRFIEQNRFNYSFITIRKPIYFGDLIPSIASYKKIIEKYDKGIKEGKFYEEPIGGDFNYPDW